MGLLPTVPLFPHPHYSKARKPSRAYFINSFATWAPATRSHSADFSGLRSRGGRPLGEAGQRAAGRAQRLPRPGAVLALGASRLPQPGSPALGAQRRRHVFRGQRERPAAAGGAAQAGGRCGEDQGLAGSCRASTVLHAECLQGCPAGRCSSWKQPLPGAQILCFILKAVRKKFTEECF